MKDLSHVTGQELIVTHLPSNIFQMAHTEIILSSLIDCYKFLWNGSLFSNAIRTPPCCCHYMRMSVITEEEMISLIVFFLLYYDLKGA